MNDVLPAGPMPARANLCLSGCVAIRFMRQRTATAAERTSRSGMSRLAGHRGHRGCRSMWATSHRQLGLLSHSGRLCLGASGIVRRVAVGNLAAAAKEGVRWLRDRGAIWSIAVPLPFCPVFFALAPCFLLIRRLSQFCPPSLRRLLRGFRFPRHLIGVWPRI